MTSHREGISIDGRNGDLHGMSPMRRIAGSEDEMVTGIYEEKTWLSLQDTGVSTVDSWMIPMMRANRMSYIIAGLADLQPHVRSKGLSAWRPNGWHRTGTE